MNTEIQKFLEQAKKDFEAAIKNLEIDLYYVSAFLFQQSAEKGLKALWIKEKRENPLPTHNLLILATSLKLPEDLLECARVLTPHAIISRYPMKEFAPYEIYSKEEVLRLKDCTEKILKWVEEKLK